MTKPRIKLKPKTAEILVLPGNGRRDPRALLHCALQYNDAAEVTIVTRSKDGDMFISSSYATLSDMSWDVDWAKDYLRAMARGE